MLTLVLALLTLPSTTVVSKKCLKYTNPINYIQIMNVFALTTFLKLRLIKVLQLTTFIYSIYTWDFIWIHRLSIKFKLKMGLKQQK